MAKKETQLAKDGRVQRGTGNDGEPGRVVVTLRMPASLWKDARADAKRLNMSGNEYLVGIIDYFVHFGRKQKPRPCEDGNVKKTH